MKPGKKTVVVLLVSACILSAILLATTPHVEQNAQINAAGLDSIISSALAQANIARRSVRTRTVAIDSSFSRKEYRVEVPTNFSKTSFHLKLHHTLLEYDVDCPARVVFPENNMTIYLSYGGTIHRTLQLINTESVTQ